jgi:diacylglycerol kinase (ATP)
MKATLIYNPNSGGNGRVKPEEMVAALQAAGYQAVFEPTKTEDDLDRVLEGGEELVVVAGGDGTVRAVATRTIGKPVQLALIPMGTANNIAAALGLAGKPLEIISGLEKPIRRYFDMCLVQVPWGRDYFLEAAGYGLYANMLAEYKPEKGKSVLRSLEAISRTLSKLRTEHCSVILDGEDISGAYLLLEVMNTPAFGPRIKANPEADPGDGQFEVIRIREDRRSGVLGYIRGLVNEELAELPNVEVTRGQKLEISWNGFPVHIDAEVRPPGYEPPQEAEEGARSIHEEQVEGNLCFEIMPKSLEFWLPEPGPDK